MVTRAQIDLVQVQRDVIVQVILQHVHLLRILKGRYRTVKQVKPRVKVIDQMADALIIIHLILFLSKSDNEHHPDIWLHFLDRMGVELRVDCVKRFG